mgnify:CR=1 FL=1
MEWMEPHKATEACLSNQRWRRETLPRPNPPAYMKHCVAIWNKKKSAKSQKRIREELINISIDQTEEQACLNYDENKRQKNKLGPQGPALNDMLDEEELIEDPDEDTIGTTTITTRTKSESSKTSYLSGS